MRLLGDKTIAQMDLNDFLWQANTETNSASHIIKHLWGNMLSRWTDVYTTDGEKPDRQRDTEFELDENITEEEIRRWRDEGWHCFLQVLEEAGPDDLTRTIRIRNQDLYWMVSIGRWRTIQYMSGN